MGFPESDSNKYKILKHGRKLVLDHWIVFFTHYEIGSLYQRQGKFQDALRHYQLVLSGKPTEADLHKIVRSLVFSRLVCVRER